MHESNSFSLDDKQQIIKNLLKDQIKKKTEFKKVTETIRKKLTLQLTETDWKYVEHKYVKYCAKFWFNDVAECLDDSDYDIEEFLQNTRKNLFNIESLDKIPEPFRDLKYFKLLKKMRTSTPRKLEMKIIIEFTEKCLGKIIIASSDAAQEFRFFQALAHFIDTFRYPLKLFASLKLKEFCSGDISANDLLRCVKNLDINIFGKEVVYLKRTAEEFLIDDLLLIPNLKLILKATIDSFEINQKKMDGREVIEIKGRNVALSEILDSIKNYVSSNIEELRIISNYVHIDSNLDNEVWHGKNIVVRAKHIEVHDKIVWNISGIDNDTVYSTNAGTNCDGNGKQGEDGYPGESGGNILILAKELKSFNNFTIFSNGGKGSNGQDGGDGKNGADGKGISWDEFKRKFPSSCKVIPGIESTSNYKITLNSIENEGGTVGFGNFGEHYVNTTTSNGHNMIFSSNHNLLRPDSAYFVYKGTLGKPGGHGGEYGFGGQGGYAGELMIINHSENKEFNIPKRSQPGRDGENGKGGLNGKHGMHGWDLGYMDYQFWTDTKFYGNVNSSITLEYYNSDDSSRVWCMYKEKYVAMETSAIQHHRCTQYQERNNMKQNSSRQNHAQATRKKNISQQNILANYQLSELYEESLNAQESISELEKINLKATQAFVQNEIQQQKYQLKIDRLAMYTGNEDPCSNHVEVNTIDLNKDNMQTELWVCRVKNNTQVLDNWLQLKSVELNREQLNTLFESLEELKLFSFINSVSWFNEAKNILLEKYKYVTLQGISKQFCLEVEPKHYIEPEAAVMHLVEQNNNLHDIPHTQSNGSLNEYLFKSEKEKNQKFGKYINKNLAKVNHQVLKSFVLEKMELTTTPESIKQYYVEFLVKENCFIRGDLESFMKWIVSRKTTNHKSGSENTAKQQYDWTKCGDDEKVLEQFKSNIENKGPLSESYREQLAIEFGLNIRTYIITQDKKLILQNNHNPSSKECMHVLLRNNDFVKLDVDEKLAVLDDERKERNKLYRKFLIDVETFKKKQEFDEYLTDKKYLSQTYAYNDKMLYNEQEYINKIVLYFDEGERKELRARLEKLTFEFIGKNNILINLKQRFQTDGKHVSFQEMCFLINAVLLQKRDNRHDQDIFSWIISGYPQRNWIDELLLLQLENHFKISKETPKWRQLLSQINNIETLLWFSIKLGRNTLVKEKCVQDCLYMLSRTPQKIDNLGTLELTEWPDAIKEKYWTCKLSGLSDWNQSDLSTAVLLVLAVENNVGNELMEEFIGVVKNKNIPATEFSDILSNFYYEKWILSKPAVENLGKCQINNWKEQMNKKFSPQLEERDMELLAVLIDTSAYSSQGIISNLSNISDNFRKIQYEEKNAAKDYNKHSQIKSMLEKLYKPNESNRNIRNKLIAIIDRVIELKRGFKLRDTQKLAVLTLLFNDTTSTLAQVSTGEGKSLIVVVAAILMAMCKEKVHIVTSSSVLAKRDAEINRDIYNLFGIDVGHNCDENVEKNKEAYSNNQVVYGDLSSFQRDYLLDKFYGVNILGDHNCKNVIIDEVDSMLLDKGNNMLYLSHNLAGLDKLESVYIHIWNMINMQAIDKSSSSFIFDTDAIKHTIMDDIFGIVTKHDIQKLDPTLKEHHTNTIWENLIKSKILNANGRLLKSDINLKDESVLPVRVEGLLDRLDFLLHNCKDKEKAFHIPNYLVPFVEQHLGSWIDSARTAFFMIPKQHYVVDVEKSEIRPDRNPIITILDTDTGTDQTNSQWDKALHQFLQLKHGCKITLQNLKAVFISNVSYFKEYKKIYGLTGTLGSQRERELLEEVYKVDFIVIPTAKPKQFIEYKEILCDNNEKWINEVHKTATEITRTKQRSILIICETVKEVHEMEQAFGNAENVHTYTRDYEEFNIAQGTTELAAGQIIIATNLAGRGTDIKLTDQLKKAGGLHVCLTYLPSNTRIEQQAFGRAARCGNLGSGQLIFYNKKKQGNSSGKPSVSDLKNQRDSEELRRLSEVKNYYETQIAVEEKCFEKFKRQYEILKKRVTSDCLSDNKHFFDTLINYFRTNNRKEIEEMLLRSTLDRWAFWLDRNNVQYEHSKSHSSLDEFILQLKQLKCNTIEDLFAWVKDQPVHMVKLGIILTECDKHENAITLFDQVIENEPYFSEAAHYYKAYALTKQTKWDEYSFKKQLREASKLLREHENFHTISIGIVNRIKRNDNTLVEIKAFQEQQNGKANIYQAFLQSIDTILGHQVTSKSFIDANISEEISEMLYEDLLKEKVLTKPKIKSVHEDQLKAISSDYRVPIQELKKFLSKWDGKEIDETTFLKDLKQSVELHSRETFWKYSVVQGILHSETKYVAVNTEKLEKVDPSLVDFLAATNMLEEKNEIFEAGKIFLYEEYVEEQKKYRIYIKKDFVNLIGRDRYLALKIREGVLSFNRVALLSENLIENANFSSFDSITFKDLKSIGISAGESNKILSELVDLNILVKYTSQGNDIYKLRIKTSEFEKVQLPSFPVYDTEIRGLLFQCFSYRTAFEGIVAQLSNEILPVRIPLMIKPHRLLLQDLMHHGIVKPVVVNANIDLKEKLYKIYAQHMSRDSVLQMLNQSKIVPQDRLEKLLTELVEKSWITSNDSNQYSINRSFSGTPLNTSYTEVQKSIECIFSARLQLTKENSVESVIRILTAHRSMLKVSKAQKFKHVPLDGISNINLKEKHIFELNALDKIITLEIESEKIPQQTKLYLGCFLILCAVALVQIVIGTGLTCLTKGLFATAGVALIWEGAKDVYAALSSPGKFKWSDYSRYKVVTLTLNTFFLSLPKVKKCTTKFIKSSFFADIAKTSNGGRIIKSIIPTVLLYINKIFQKRHCEQLLDSSQLTVLKPRKVLELTEGNIEARIDNSLKNICYHIKSELLTAATQALEKHDIFSSITKLYQVRGKQLSETYLNNIQNEFFSFESISGHLLLLGTIVTGSAIEEIKAVKRLSNTHPFKLLKTINEEVKWLEQDDHTSIAQKLVRSMLDKTNGHINQKINHNELDTQDVETYEQDRSDRQLMSKEENERLTTQTLSGWKKMLLENLEKFIEQRIENSILLAGRRYMLKYVAKYMQPAQNNSNASELNQICNDLRPQYEESRRNKRKNVICIDEQITEKYRSVVLELMSRQKNSKVLATLVRENIPMGLNCVSFLVPVVQKVLQNGGLNVPGLTLVIENGNNQPSTFSKVKLNTQDVGVRLSLENNLFIIDHCETLETTSETNSQNNCLYNALSQIIPEFKDKFPENLRERVANFIERDESIQNFIQQGRHQNLLPFEVYQDSMLNSSGMDSSEIVRVSTHVVSRFVSFIRFGGIIQLTSNKTGLATKEIVCNVERLIKEKENTNVVKMVRTGEIDQRLQRKSSYLYYTLVDFLKYTQRVPDYVDLWYDIDKFQVDHLDTLISINFTGVSKQADKDKVNTLKLNFLHILGINIIKRSHYKELVSELIKACEIISNSSFDNLHKEGSKVYNYFNALTL